MNRLDIKRTLTLATQMFRGGWLPMVGITALLSVPYFIYMIVIAMTSQPGTAVAYGVGMLNTMVMSLGMAFCVSLGYAALRGESTRIGDHTGRVLSAAPSALGAYVIFYVAVVFGSFFCFVPGIIAGIVWFVFFPAAILEGRGPLESLSRSKELTQGQWGPLALTLMVYVLVLTMFLTPFIAVNVYAEIGLRQSNPELAAQLKVVSAILQAPMSVLFSASFTCLITATFVELRTLRDRAHGGDPGQTAALFE